MAVRWQEAEDAMEKDVIFARILRECMSLPVVKATMRRTAQMVGGQNPRFADEELQAVRRAVWRSLKRYDPGRGVPFQHYVSRGLKVAIHDFWRVDSWNKDLCVHVPQADWKRWRMEEARRASGDELAPDSDPTLDMACRNSALWDSLDLLACVDEEERDD